MIEFIKERFIVTLSFGDIFGLVILAIIGIMIGICCFLDLIYQHNNKFRKWYNKRRTKK